MTRNCEGTEQLRKKRNYCLWIFSGTYGQCQTSFLWNLHAGQIQEYRLEETLSYLWKKSALLSIGSGTALYMALVQTIFH